MAHKSDPIEKVRKRVEQDTREHKARVQEEQERKKNLWRVWTLFQAIVCSWDGGIKKKFPRIPEKEIRATYFQEVSGHIIDLRKQLAVARWRTCGTKESDSVRSTRESSIPPVLPEN